MVASASASASASVTVIIPTICEGRREQLLLAAIDSVKRQHNVSADILVVVNGSRYEPALLERLFARKDIHVEYLETGSLPLAIEYGRGKVETDFFCFLDDDDALLEDSLSSRLVPFSDPAVDVVVSNGYNSKNNQREIRVKNGAMVSQNPLMALMEQNWLASCGGLFRSRTITPDIFVGLIKYYEWTTLAFRLSLLRKVVFIETPGYVVNDTPISLSKNSDFMLSDEKIVREMLSYPLSKPVKQVLKKKLSQSLHNTSTFMLEHGRIAEAWRYHLASMGSGWGLQYLLYTRKLILPQLYRR